MKILGRFGWPLVFLGLLVVLAATMYFMVRAEDLETASIMASGAADVIKAEAFDHQRAQLRAWPGITLGVGLTLLGIILIQLRRWKEARDESLDSDGAPVLAGEAQAAGDDDGILAYDPEGREARGEAARPAGAHGLACPHCGRSPGGSRERTWVDEWAERYSADPELRERVHKLLAQMEQRDGQGTPASRRALHRRLRGKVERDELPRELPEKIVLGPAGGESCDLCDELVQSAQMLNTLQMADGRLFRLHVVCLSLWRDAHRRRAASGREPRGE